MVAVSSWGRSVVVCFSLGLILSAVSVAEESQSEHASLAPQAAERVDNLRLLPGFVGERVYQVPRDREGSWVALCRGPEGTLFASDQ